MSADRSHAALSLLLVSAASLSGGVARSSEQVPDPAFLEYLGMWEESDDEWLLVSEGVEHGTDAEEVPDGHEDPAENVDEQTSGE